MIMSDQAINTNEERSPALELLKNRAIDKSCTPYEALQMDYMQHHLVADYDVPCDVAKKFVKPSFTAIFTFELPYQEAVEYQTELQLSKYLQKQYSQRSTGKDCSEDVFNAMDLSNQMIVMIHNFSCTEALQLNSDPQRNAVMLLKLPFEQAVQINSWKLYNEAHLNPTALQHKLSVPATPSDEAFPSGVVNSYEDIYLVT
jgi:hypothetical protein